MHNSQLGLNSKMSMLMHKLGYLFLRIRVKEKIHKQKKKEDPSPGESCGSHDLVVNILEKTSWMVARSKSVHSTILPALDFNAVDPVLAGTRCHFESNPAPLVGALRWDGGSDKRLFYLHR